MALTEDKKKSRHTVANSFSHTSSGTDGDDDRRPRERQKNLSSRPEKKGHITEPSADNWTGTELTESPRIDPVNFSLHGDPNVAAESRTKPGRVVPLKFMRSTTPDSTAGSIASSSRVRWEQLRHHVLRPATPPPSQSAATISSSATSQASHSQPAKPSRLARLGFRSVVEHAREVVSDDARKFAQELNRICWSIRLTEPQKARAEREAGSTGSSSHMHFKPDLPFVAGAAVSTVEAHRGGTGKSFDKLHLASSGPIQLRTVASVGPLHQSIQRHAIPFQDGMCTTTHLPSESLVLSTLLIPFFNTKGSPYLDEERWLAIETFEFITRTWAPMDEVSPRHQLTGIFC